MAALTRWCRGNTEINLLWMPAKLLPLGRGLWQLQHNVAERQTLCKYPPVSPITWIREFQTSDVIFGCLEGPIGVPFVSYEIHYVGMNTALQAHAFRKGRKGILEGMPQRLAPINRCRHEKE